MQWIRAWRRPPRKCQRLTPAGESLALADAGDIDEFAGRAKRSTKTRSPGFGFVGRIIEAHFAEAPHRRKVGLLEVPGPSAW